jgi:ABC-type multidrug transport system ATPase subunit
MEGEGGPSEEICSGVLERSGALTVRETIGFAARLSPGTGHKKRARALIKAFVLREQEHVMFGTGGQKACQCCWLVDH